MLSQDSLIIGSNQGFRVTAISTTKISHETPAKNFTGQDFERLILQGVDESRRDTRRHRSPLYRKTGQLPSFTERSPKTFGRYKGFIRAVNLGRHIRSPVLIVCLDKAV